MEPGREAARGPCIKLSVVASDIFGVSGRQMMAALIAGERDPRVLAELARTRMRARIPQWASEADPNVLGRPTPEVSARNRAGHTLSGTTEERAER